MRIKEPVQMPGAPERISYAQNMEDILLDRLFPGQKGTYVDVGANHPFHDSNTYFFYLRGWRGVTIEPAAEGHALFLKYRPEDLNLNVAVSDAFGELPFYEISQSGELTGLSTLEAEVAESHRAQGFEVRAHHVPVRTLAALIDEHRIPEPDVLSIDVENHEKQVILGIPWDKWRPRVLVVEATVPLSKTPTHHTWEPLLTAQGYLFATSNGINRFYLRPDMKDRLPLLETPVSSLDEYYRHEVFYYLRGLDQAQGELADARFQFEQERGGWAWAQTMAAHAQAMWEHERAEFNKLRSQWHAMYLEGESARANWELERAEFARCHQEFEAQRAEWECQRAHWESERANYERQHASDQSLLGATQRELRPYRLIDRFGVVGSSYALARRIKRKIAS
ncbi:MAG TPA: FkbM family methyltransferase [Isosphaeraceae bacterium]|jgi:FkbM family methyltransferase|nr:FkbM family methyltransferase [Isosphaeraceae bacterium]